MPEKGSTLSEERVIEQLRRKLSLLVENGHFASLDAIAKSIGTTQKTLEGWADYGSNKITKGLIPQKHYQPILDVFTNAISKYHRGVNVDAIVKGEVNELARYLSENPRLTFHELVDREAIKQKSKVFIDQKTGLTAVKRRSEPKLITNYSVTTQQWFWIEFQSGLVSSHTIAIQQRGNDWAFSDVEYVKDENQLVIPGLRRDGFPDSIQETDWDGINTFYALQIHKPWAQSIIEAIKSNAPIDNAFLQTIADHFMSNSPDKRCLFAIELDIKKT